MSSRFDPDPESYFSITIDPFPNFFMMLGPNSAIGSGSLTMMIESAGDYIIKAIRKIQKEDIRSMTVKARRVRDFQEYADEYFKKTVYVDDCSSWYRSKGGRITGLWPGSTMHAIEAFRSPRWEDYEYEYEGEQEDEDEEDNAEEAEEAKDQKTTIPAANQILKHMRPRDGGSSGHETGSKRRTRTRTHPAAFEANRLAWLGNGWSQLQLDEGGDLAYYLEPEYMDVPAHPFPEETGFYRVRPFTY